MTRNRPFFFDRIERLEALVADAATSLTCLEAIANELSHRSTWRARKLAARLKARSHSVESKHDAELQPHLLDPRSALGIKLSTLPLSTRAENAVVAHRVTLVGELAQLTEAELLQSRNVGRKTLAELRHLLGMFGLRFGADFSGDRSTPAATQVELPTEFRIKEPKSLCGALKAHVEAATNSPRNARWTIEHFGWDGMRGRTLDAIGRSANVTRERVRQIAAKCARSLRAKESIPKPLARALALIRKHAPMTQSTLDRLLTEAEIAAGNFDIYGIKSAAKVFGLKFPFLVVDGRDQLIIQKRFSALPSALVKSARREIAAHGAIVDDQLVELGRDLTNSIIEPAFAHSILKSEGTFARLRGCEDWWWQPARAARGRNRLVNTIAKVVAACETISLSELREACRRHVRTNHIAPPTRVISAICASMPFLNVRDSRVRRIESAFDWDDVLNSSEKQMLKLFDTWGPVLSSLEVTEQGMALGINENSLSIYKTYSPLLWRPAPGYYAIVGREIPVGLLDDLGRRKVHSKPLLEFGWTSDHRILVTRRVTDGVWLSGIITVPSAVQKFIQGEFALSALGKHASGSIAVKDGNAFGFKSFFRIFGADVGDILMIVFDPRSRSCESWLGGSELSEVIHSGPDAIMSYLSGTDHESIAA